MPRPMKDSGVEWLGNIPAHWKRDKVARIFQTIGSGTTPKSENPDYYNGNVNWIQSGDINDGFLTNTKVTITDEAVKQFSALKIYEAPFIIMAMYGASIGNLSISKINACVNQACCVMKNGRQDIRYSFYALKIAKDYLVWKGVGGGQQNISQDIIKQLWLPVPPLEEQQRIATFLDGKCARIDSVIEKTRASIEEYKKLKQSLITRAVTKGIRPARPMKHSGVEWIGDIPADWDCCKLKYLISSLNSGISVTATDLIDEGYPVYGGGQQIGFFSQFNMEDTIVVGRVGAKCGCVTKVIGKAWATDNALIVTTDFPKDYLYYILVAAELNKLSTSNAQPLITSGKVLNHKVAVPPLEEQKEIAQYLDEKTAVIDLVVGKKNQLVTELERLKKSLIFEYVTGKKAVAI